MRKLAGLFLLLLLFCDRSTAQTALPLSKLHFQAGAAFPFYVSAPYDHYRVSTAAPRIQAGANLGNGELYLAASSFSFRSDALPVFSSSLFTLGYCYNIRAYKKTWIKPGLAFGNNYIQFYELANVPHNKESELMLEASLHAQTALYKKLHLCAGAAFQRTMLFHRFDMMSVQLALVYYLDTPRFAKKLID